MSKFRMCTDSKLSGIKPQGLNCSRVGNTVISLLFLNACFHKLIFPNHRVYGCINRVREALCELNIDCFLY